MRAFSSFPEIVTSDHVNQMFNLLKNDASIGVRMMAANTLSMRTLQDSAMEKYVKDFLGDEKNILKYAEEEL